MKKIVVKTALITLASAVALLLLAFGIASLAFPDKMSELSESMGNKKLALSYAERQYEYTGSTEDLYRCADLCIRIGDKSKTVKYCEKLVGKQNFKECCGTKVEYVYGSYATALYLSGEEDKALEIADLSVADGFGVPNTYGTLTLKALDLQDKEFGAKLLSAFSEIEVPQEEFKLNYYNAIKVNLEKLVGVN